MTIYWIRAENPSVIGVLEEVERALGAGDTGVAPSVQLAPVQTGDEDEAYLMENLDLAEATWSVDPSQIVRSSRPGLAAAINAFQRLIRRATWWYLLPQWMQSNQFHGAVVRVLNALLNRQRHDRARLDELAQLAALAEPVPIIQRRLAVMRLEQRELRRRIAALEAQLAELANQRKV